MLTPKCICGHDEKGHYIYTRWLQPCAEWDLIDGQWKYCECENYIGMRRTRLDRIKEAKVKKLQPGQKLNSHKYRNRQTFKVSRNAIYLRTYKRGNYAGKD